MGRRFHFLSVSQGEKNELVVLVFCIGRAYSYGRCGVCGFGKVTVLFSEVEKYESDVKLTQSLRRLCYVMTMLLSDRVYHDLFWDVYIDEIGQVKFTEDQFPLDHYNHLISIFPRARDIFNKKRFLDE